MVFTVFKTPLGGVCILLMKRILYYLHVLKQFFTIKMVRMLKNGEGKSLYILKKNYVFEMECV